MAAAARLLSDVFRTCDCKKLRQYINKGYECNARQSEAPHSSLLHMVSALTCTDCDKGSTAQKIFEGGAEMDVKNDDGVTPLMMCAVSGNDRVAEVLLQAGVDVHAVCNKQSTALHWAAANNRTALVQLLLATGASVAAVCDDGSLALHAACSHGENCNLELIMRLVSCGEPGLVNTYNRDVVTPLLAAVCTGCSTEIVTYLLANGADANATNVIGAHALIFVSEIAMLRQLIDAGGTVNNRNSLGDTVLHAVAQFGRSAGIICCLLKAGADATATDATGSTPAEVALAYDHAATAALLQRAEADQRSKQQQQQQQQRVAPLPADRQILHGWQSSIDIEHRGKTVSAMVDHLEVSQGEQWRSTFVELIARVEFELYRRAADITAYSDVSTLQTRLNDLVADGLILQTQLKQGVCTHAAAATIAHSTTDKVAVSAIADAAVINREAGAQQRSHTAHDSGDSDSTTATSSAGSSGHDVQQQHQQQQQQQQQPLPTLTPLCMLYTAGSSAPGWHCTERDAHAPIRQQVIHKCLERWLAVVADLSRVSQSECGVLAVGLEAAMYTNAGSLELYSSDMLMKAAIEACVAILKNEEPTAQPALGSSGGSPGLSSVRRRQHYLMSTPIRAVAQAVADIAQQRQQHQQQQSSADTLRVSSPPSASSSRSAAHTAAAEPVCNISGTLHDAHGQTKAAAAVCAETVTASTELLYTGGVSASTSNNAAVQPTAECSTTAGDATAADNHSQCTPMQQMTTDSSVSRTASCSTAFAAGNSGHDVQQQQQQLMTAAAAAATVAAAGLNYLPEPRALVGSLGTTLIGGNLHSMRNTGSDNRNSGTAVDITVSDRAHVTAPVSQHDSTCVSVVAECAGSSTTGIDCISSSIENVYNRNNNSIISSSSSSGSSSISNNSSSSESKWHSMTVHLLQLEHQKTADASVAVDSTDDPNSSSSSSDHSSGSGDNTSNVNDIADSSSEAERASSITEQLLALQAQRVAAARQKATAAAAAAATAATAVTEASARVTQLQVASGTAADEAALVAVAEAAADKASAAYTAQAIACKLLQAELHSQREQLLCLSNAEQHSTTVTADVVTAVLDESESDDDCPPLAHANSLKLHDSTHTAKQPVVAVVLASCSSGSTGNSYNATNSSGSDNEQYKQQQPSSQCSSHVCSVVS
jgi:ankyrin repeat protein